MTRTKPFSRRNIFLSAAMVIVAAALAVTPWRLVAQEASRTDKPKSEDPLAAGYDLSHIVHFEVGSTQLREGDNITIKEVRGTADTMSAGNMYLVKGTYKLHSAAKAQLAAFTTVDAQDPQSRQFEHVPTMKTQTAIVDEGEGRFALLFYMWQDGWPHISFYPAEGGNGMGGVYFGTGKSVLK